MKTRIFTITTLALLLIFLPSWARSAPFETQSDGSIRHEFSGFVFPKQIGFFHREKMHQYNQAGSDISAGYNAGALIVATVYAYPAPDLQSADVLSREYASKRAEVQHGHQGVSVLSEGNITFVQGGRKFTGKRACFSFHDIFAFTPQDLKSQLLVFHDGGVFVEYRFTYPDNHADRAELEIEKFIHAWSWR